MINAEAPYVRIVEDSDVLAELMGVTLGFEGIRYAKTTNNFQLLLFPEPWEGVTTVLCDLDLGGPVTGEMILAYLEGTHPWINRVVLSATAEVTDARILSLAHAVLSKPADLRDIMKVIK